MSATYHLRSDLCLFHADMREALAALPDCCIDAVVTDPPYHLTSIVKRFANTSEQDATKTSQRVRDRADGYSRLVATGFMGKQWDGGDLSFQPETWCEVWRVLKPGGHLIAMGGTRTFARMSVAIEDAGFEVRDTLMWIYGTGFPKSHDISRAIDKAAGAKREIIGCDPNFAKRNKTTSKFGDVYGQIKDVESCPITAPATDAARQWEGWGTALKPAVEPIVLARKPLSEPTVAANVLRWGTGAINIDGCRISSNENWATVGEKIGMQVVSALGPNLNNSGRSGSHELGRWPANVLHDGLAGSAARFFYSAKASKADRAGSKHPTVKPVALMQWLVRLVTPPGGVVLDPFAGSGTTGVAALAEGCKVLLIERESEYVDDVVKRFLSACVDSQQVAA